MIPTVEVELQECIRMGRVRACNSVTLKPVGIVDLKIATRPVQLRVDINRCC